ncbi:hypothetical protein G4B88_028687 [Cannabis sativa]|uniref:Uncharacterized protein n=1 Tax=Cannabis sativa TaxID=3483 RepID=A0A7J6ENR1_CANSA|nr:hypothetical protein G4B88_028687 [Cannabis sativa]
MSHFQREEEEEEEEEEEAYYDFSDSDGDFDFDFVQNTKSTDITAKQARAGKDIQGIPWEGLTFSRDQYRQTRLEQYNNYENMPFSGHTSSMLRNLVWTTSKHDVYLFWNHLIIHWSPLTSTMFEVLNLSGHVAPFEHLDRPGVSYCAKTVTTDNAITNAIEIYTSPSGAAHFTSANNDCGVRDFDMERFHLSKSFVFPWAVNHTSLSPDGELLVVVGDNQQGMLVDSQTGKTVKHLRGHLDFSFASAWHPDGITFATGNQDKTCRLWDVRNLSKSVAVLKGNLGAIRSIRYTSDGQYMAMAEAADFVHIYDVKSGSGYEKEHEIDLFGEISGISFSPDTETLFIGIWDRTYGSLLEYGRHRNYTYLDSLI